MNNYKIRVNNEAESREAQELFFALGYKKGVCTSGGYPATIVAVVESLHRDTPFYSRALSLNHDAHKDYIELTLPQLRDLVVLHRKDVNDATHVGKSGSEYYVTDIREVYFFDGMEWFLKDVDVSNLKPIQKLQPEHDLISGKDALRALADGEEVEIKSNDQWVSVENCSIYQFLRGNWNYKFRLKPRTVKLEIEVPAPFQPKVGDIYFIVHPAFKSGYTCNTFVDTEKHKEFVKYGAWRTVEDIKIVVEQLRKIKEHSK